jgi:hypothetical protein
VLNVPTPRRQQSRPTISTKDGSAASSAIASSSASRRSFACTAAVYDAAAWTLAHDAWLRRQRFESRPLQLALEES